MRLDYTSYVVAIICLLFAGIVFATAFAITPAALDATTGTVMTVVLAVLGLIVAGVGYSQKPKETILPPSEKVQQTQQVQQMQQEQQVQTETVPLLAPASTSTSASTTATPPEEIEKPKEEIKPEIEPEKKVVRRRRKKTEQS